MFIDFQKVTYSPSLELNTNQRSDSSALGSYMVRPVLQDKIFCFDKKNNEQCIRSVH